MGHTGGEQGKLMGRGDSQRQGQGHDRVKLGFMVYKVEVQDVGLSAPVLLGRVLRRGEGEGWL
jgi:hypothetical protein